MLKRYLTEITEIANRSDAREESYYSTLTNLLNEWATSRGKTNIKITTLPKKTEAGNPDFRVWDGKQHIVGYIEAKPHTTENLDPIEQSEQLKRYRQTFPNLILTNFFEFRLYRNGNLIDSVLIARPFAAHKLKIVPPVEKEEKFNTLLEKFFSFSIPRVYEAETLAKELAKRTRFLKDEVIIQELNAEQKQGGGALSGFYQAFNQYLISGLKPEEFADLYSQTITYGLFAARTRSENGFNRKLAYENIPHTIGILRDVFRFVSLDDLPKQMEWIVDDIAEVLAVTDVKNILHKYFHEGKGKDPIVHFYETFLAVYDPQTRERRGVYYTPEPVVSYIVRSLHQILKNHFRRTDGFANNTVTVLDPAAGTLTFLAEAAKLAVEEFVLRYGEGGRRNLIKDHILKNFYAFELMMAPYAIGHLKISFLLEELGYRLTEQDRFKLYLTNTLDMEELAETTLPGMSSLSEESHLAGRVKKKTPILVILGNPPYSGISANMKPEMVNFLKEDRDGIQSYYKVDGKPLKEKNPKWLQDDYVKFIRFAQWKIAQAGEGVLGFITNHSYLDNPTFRGMRQSLMKTFNEIYILDLHGNSLKKERCPDGSKDENVFDIQQGVAIALFIKKKGKENQSQVYHSELWGLREKKYDWLNKNDIIRTKWKKLTPQSEYYLFIPREETLLKTYERFTQITEIFIVKSVGVVTSRDNLVINQEKNTLKNNVRMLLNDNIPDEIVIKTFDLRDKPKWKLKEVRETLRGSENWGEIIIQILYRPFDIRWIFYHDVVIERPRKEVMRHMMQENLGLLTCRQQNKVGFHHIFVSENITESCVVSNKTREINYLFPLYIYPDTDKSDLFAQKKSSRKREPNIKQEIFTRLAKAYIKKPAPEDIFYYIYAVLYSNIYREKYAEFLKIDFPRIPFSKNYTLFCQMAELGKRLVDLHLLKSDELETPVAKFQGKGKNLVEKVRYEYEKGKVHINNEQFFEGVSPDVWNYQIGGYRVCEKWLKDRKGRTLSLDEIIHYCRVVTAIQKTIAIQQLVDDIYPEAEKELIE